MSRVPAIALDVLTGVAVEGRRCNVNLAHAIAGTLACCLATSPGWATAAGAESGAEPERGGGAAVPPLDTAGSTLWLTVENDYFAASDDGYTGGFSLGISHASPTRSPYPDGTRTRTSWSLVQQVYTPDALEATMPASHERAWASWLYLERALESDDGTGRRRLAASLGVVGPSAGGGALQRAAHRAVDGVEPRGWDTQLQDRPTVQLSAEAGERIGFMRVLGIETTALAHADLALGTVRRHAGVGASIETGFGAAGRALGGRARRWHVALGAHVRHVDHDLLVEERGDAPGRLTPERWVSDLTLEVATRFGSLEFGYRHVVRSAEYAEQGQGDRYGALSLRVFR